MKSISKFFVAAVAVTALASCSDDLGLGSNGLTGNADMVASLETTSDAFTRMAMNEAGTDAYGGKKDLVWSKDDKIRVFTLDKLSQDIYQLTSGAGETEAQFTRIQSTGLTGDKYAITEADMVYGVSAAEIEDGVVKPRLTLTLPEEYTPGTDANGNVKFPIPYWGACEVSGDAEDATVKASLKGLTAYLRVSFEELPEGTNYIVLTTHGGNIYKPEEGFMLAPFDAPSDAAFKDNRDWWYATDDDDAYTNAQWITGGYSEALSGTLNCILEDSPELAIDERLVHNDQIVVNLPSNKKGVFYIPIVCGEYKNLHVIAASYVSDTYKYCYAGTELTVFQDFTAVRNKMYYLNMNLINLTEACIGDINQMIATKNKTAGVTTLISVDKLFYAAHTAHNTNNGAHKGYKDDQIVFTGKGNVVLAIKEIGENQGYGDSEDKPLLATDKATASLAVTKDAKGFNQFFYINVPSGWGDGDAKYLSVNTGKTDAVIGTTDGANADNINVNVFGSATRFSVTHNDIFEVDNTIKEEPDAAVKIAAGFNKVTIAEDTKGDVHVYTNGLQAQEETEVVTLDIVTTEGIGIRLDDALIGALKFSEGNADRNLYSTGSSAIKEVQNSEGLAYAKASPDDAAKNTPTHVNMRSYWTGKALSAYAIANGYDVSVIWTTAQLASVGEGIYPTSLYSSNHALPGEEMDPAVKAYSIPNALMRMMWLGADAYPWIGARVRTGDFTIDGENVELKNMNFLTDWLGNTTFVDDPHWCCTSCWTPNQATPTIDLSKYVGLFRSINAPYTADDDDDEVAPEAGAVKILNINLQDVELINADKDISNVGAISGYVNATTLDVINNVVGEVKISMKGDYIGGMFGEIDAAGETNIKNNEVYGRDNNSGYIVSTDGQYVGGIAGDLTTTNPVNILDNVVSLDQDIAGEAYAAGLIGNFVGVRTINTLRNNVEVANITATDSDYAAGLYGKYEITTGNSAFVDNEVVATTITAKNQFAAGFVGQSTMLAAQYACYISGKVTAEKIQADNGFVGGEIGQVDKGKTYIGQNNEDDVKAAERDYATEIVIGTLAGKYAVGGVIGNNARSMQTRIVVNLGESDLLDADGEPYETTATVAILKFENTKTEADFASNEVQYFGTMSNILGYMQDHLTINGEASLAVVDNLQAEMKEAVLYKLHRDQDHNPQYSAGQRFWGDTNGYVGWRATGIYTIDGKESRGEQLQGTTAPHNMFKNDERYTENSKLVISE